MAQAREAWRLAEGRSLNPTERARLIAEILVSYQRARRALRDAPIETAVGLLRGDTLASAAVAADAETDVRPVSPSPPSTALGPCELGEAHRLGRAVQRTLRLLPGDTRCLTRSLVLTQLLSRRAIPAKLVIGARAQPSFLAHAWVECSGQPVLPAGDGSFGRLVEL